VSNCTEKRWSMTSTEACPRASHPAIRRTRHRLALALGVLIASAAPTLAKCPANADAEQWVDGGELCLAMAVAGTKDAGPSPTLVVLVHGDTSSGGPADYLVPFARSLTRKVVTVSLLRPGYEDRAGRKSEGSHNGRRDSYTAQNVDAVGAAIQTLKTRFRARRVIAMGHSGGAAIIGVLAGRRPGLIDAAVLVSCPCDIPSWRAARGRGEWRQSLSPHSYAAKVPKQTTVVAITGSEDDNTSPRLARTYIASLAGNGSLARFEAAPGAGHRFNGPLAASAKGALEALLK